MPMCCKVFPLLLICIFIALVSGNGADTHAQDDTYTKILDIGKGQARSLDWKPDGSQLAVGSNQGVWLYDAELTLIGHLDTPPDYTVDALAWSPDGSLLAGSTGWELNEGMFIWDTTSWAVVQTLDATGIIEFAGYFSLEWSHDNTMLAINYMEGIQIWDVITGAVVNSFSHADIITDFEWSYDGSKIASISKDDTLEVWEPVSGTIFASLSIGTTFYASAVAWNDDATQLAFSSDGDIWVWDSLSQVVTLLGNYSDGFFQKLDWQGDSVAGFAYSLADSSNGIVVWDTSNGEIINSLAGIKYGMDMAWKANSSDISLAAAGRVLIWDFSTGFVIKSAEGFARIMQSIAWSPDGTKLVSGDTAHQVQVWDAGSGELLAILRGHTETISSVAWSPDGTMLASGSYDTTVRVWNVATNEMLHSLEGHEGYVLALAWHPSNPQWLASGGREGRLKIWDAVSGQPLIDLSEQNRAASINALAWRPDGNQLAAVSDDGKIRIWEVASATLIHEIELDDSIDALLSLAWSLNGTQLAGGGSGQAIGVWDIASGQLSRKLQGHRKPVLSVAWKNNTQLISSSLDGSILVWDIPSQQIIATLDNHDPINAIALDPTRTRIATANSNGTISIWQE